MANALFEAVLQEGFEGDPVGLDAVGKEVVPEQRASLRRGVEAPGERKRVAVISWARRIAFALASSNALRRFIAIQRLASNVSPLSAITCMIGKIPVSRK